MPVSDRIKSLGARILLIYKLKQTIIFLTLTCMLGYSLLRIGFESLMTYYQVVRNYVPSKLCTL